MTKRKPKPMSVPPALRSVLRRMLMRLHHEEENGTIVGNLGGGKWDLIWAHLSARPDELNILFRAAGIDVNDHIHVPAVKK